MSTGIQRYFARKQFDQLQRQARRHARWQRLLRRPYTLLPLAPLRARLLPLQARPAGTQTVALAQIVGSVDRAHDYDRQLRPLHDGLRERWIGISVLGETSGWPPVELIQVGNLYFIVDGHHRASVARHSGQTTIEARVSAYPLALTCDPAATLEAVLAALPGAVRPRAAAVPAGVVCACA